MTATHDPRTSYLVNYGQAGYLGRFWAATGHRRADRGIVRTPRGLELGTVLGEAALMGPDGTGEVLRPATGADETAALRLSQQAATILADAQALAASLALPLLFLDGEI